MSLNTLNFEFKSAAPTTIKVPMVHFGVVGSGDMEVLIEARQQEGKATICVVTPVSGFEHIWQIVLARFIDESKLGDVHISINDNNATPVVVSQRLRQALLEI